MRMEPRINYDESSRAKRTTDFRLIAHVRVLYKLFEYIVLARIEDMLDNAQPEEQHGFRKHRRRARSHGEGYWNQQNC